MKQVDWGDADNIEESIPAEELFEVTCHYENSEVLYKCSSCELTFPDMEQHLKDFHHESHSAEEEKEEPDEEEKEEPDEEANEEDEAMAFVIKNVAGNYECSTCFKAYKSLKRFVDHAKTHGDSLQSNIGMLEEILNDGKQQKQEFSCEMIKGDKGTSYRCTVCSTVFDSRKKIMLHFSIHRNVAAAIEKGNEFEATVEVHHCKLCNRSLRSGYEMDLHMKAHEENNTNGPAQTITQPESAKRKKVAGEKATYPCQYCQKEFKRPHEKVKHERVHTGEKPYSCDICGKQFRVTYCLSLHKKNVHSEERPYICTFEGCAKRFKSQSVYNHHLNTHGTAKNFKCPFCPKAFKTSVQLSGHKNTHTKPFACRVCSRAFASLYAVRIHMEVHRNEDTSLQYTCKICSAQYGRKFALTDHMKTDHPEETSELDDEGYEHFTIEQVPDEVEAEEVYSVVEAETSAV